MNDLTMDELYGDGSTHYACHKCGLCLHCGDCTAYGCGKRLETTPTDMGLVQKLRAGAEDPMWADHAEFPKRVLAAAADEIEALQAYVSNIERWQQDGEKLLVSSAATPIRAAFNLGAWWADRPWRK